MTSLTAILVAKHGYYVAVKDNVFGTVDKNDSFIDLEMTTVGFGKLLIKGRKAGQYIAINSDGILYTTPSENFPECVWFELQDGQGYHYYRSEKHGFLLGLRKDGQPKPGRKNVEGQRSVLFTVSSRENST